MNNSIGSFACLGGLGTSEREREWAALNWCILMNEWMDGRMAIVGWSFRGGRLITECFIYYVHNDEHKLQCPPASPLLTMAVNCVHRTAAALECRWLLLGPLGELFWLSPRQAGKQAWYWLICMAHRRARWSMLCRMHNNNWFVCLDWPAWQHGVSMTWLVCTRQWSRCTRVQM